MACTSTAPRTNLLPKVWGKPAWMFLYTVALGYPNQPTPQDKEAGKRLILSLQELLPCDKCRVNFREKMNGELGARLDAAVQCSETFTRYVYDLEAAVATSTGGTVPSFETTRGRVMSNTYVRPAAFASSASPPKDISPALWVTLPSAVVATGVITWAVTKMLNRTMAQQAGIDLKK